LPSGSRSTVQSKQPVTIRTYLSPDSTTLLIVNECPWRTEAELTIDPTSDCKLQRVTPSIAGDEPAPMIHALVAGRQSWKLSLAAYDVQVVRINSSDVRLVEIQTEIGAAAKAELDARVDGLGKRDLSSRSLYDRLPNPGFEATSGPGPIPHWQVVGNSTIAELDATKPRGGSTSLYLTSQTGVAGVESDLLPIPPTGQLFFTVYLRGENLERDTALRMVVESVGTERAYRNYADPQKKRPISHSWQYYGFWLNDLPLESSGKMRVRFELEGPGEVWIDEVKLYDLLCPMDPKDEYKFATVEKKELVIKVLAIQNARETGRVADCARMLQGYWPRFLMEYTPQVAPEPSISEEHAPTRPVAEPGQDAPPPTPATGLRRWIPWLR
jgi:hypothetical protein